MPSARLRSIDVLRGASVAAMILVNSQHSRLDAYPPLAHAEWNGWTLADVVFPVFVFIVGVSLALSTASRLEKGATRAELLRHALWRSGLLYLLGVLADVISIPHHGFPYVALREHLQLTGVLQKIAVCYLVAFAVTLGAGTAGVVAAIVGFNALYLGLLLLFPVPGCGPGVLTVDCNFPGWLDRTVIGRFTWDDPRQDPDGLGSLLPAISTMLLGVLAGRYLRAENEPRRRVLGLLAGGVVLVAGGAVLQRWIPVNKPMWTTSYAVLMSGLSAIALVTLVWVVDQHEPGRWVRPLEVLGSNALAAYLLSGPITNALRIHVRGTSLHDRILSHDLGRPGASLAFALICLAGVYGVTWLMVRRGWSLKL
ncbi:MAG TPA: heparan-alpha-glucosaminide N-acetyltransferase domain-containing protein [Myxococcaceae bacterium]|nr:heparan-alpha-glucosaminide N-acetyltransferase domain-containing protein [Myxococcaceae bacterium]